MNIPDADYVVIRPAASLPAGSLAAHLDGLLLTRNTLHRAFRLAPSGVIAWAAGRVETRDDGVVAEVYEMRP